MTTTAELADRVFGGILGTYDTWAIYVGDKLGFYRRMRGGQPTTADALASETGVDPRYTREWLEQQTVSGFVTCDNPSADPIHRHYRLDAAATEVFTDDLSLSFLAPFVRLVTSAGVQLPSLLEAYRSGGGVSWAQFGEDMGTGQAEMNRPWFLSALASDWFPSVPDIHNRLQAEARIADIGCGQGWSSIAFAQGYPKVFVDGYDLDGPSITSASAHAAAAGLSDRVRFHQVDAATVDQAHTYDLVTAFECIHDLAQPVPVLAAMRRLVKPEGHVVVMDERVGESFVGAGAGDVERLMYGFSLFTCLPDSMSHQPSAATGTVMRPATLEKYAQEAGFSGIDILPIENDLWRFYRLIA
ncbi:MAG TPA: methyltransferase domain-containing protein [Acidimicrobiia bacterium]|jgi:2-polyprenyl-3-methyl-5-hydroxy-6-metoxy-1,4-benzoquinol methylase